MEEDARPFNVNWINLHAVIAAAATVPPIQMTGLPVTSSAKAPGKVSAASALKALQ